MQKEIVVEEVDLRLLEDAPAYHSKQFRLTITDAKGNARLYLLDGIQVADLISDADAAWMPDAAEIRKIPMHIQVKK